MTLQHGMYDLRLSGWLAIGLLGAAGATAAIDPALLRGYPEQSLSTGAWASAYQAGFDEALPIRGASTAFMTLMTYGAFKEGRSGVLVGQNDWLFSAEEMTSLADPQRIVSTRAAYVASTAHALQARGIRVVVALIPAKLRIYPERGGSYRLLPQVEPVYDRLLGDFHVAGLEAPDLRSALLAGKRLAPMFLRTDTHWTPEGASIVASALARSIGPAHPWRATTYRFEPAKAFAHDGDLKHFLPLGAWESIGPSPDTVSGGQYVPTEVDGSQSLLDAPTSPVVLVGTSYSYNPKWRFEGALNKALNASVLNVSREGRGPFKPMQSYLDDIHFNDTPIPKVLIWEMPERYFWSTDNTVGLP